MRFFVSNRVYLPHEFLRKPSARLCIGFLVNARKAALSHTKRYSRVIIYLFKRPLVAGHGTQCVGPTRRGRIGR